MNRIYLETGKSLDLAKYFKLIDVICLDIKNYSIGNNIYLELDDLKDEIIRIKKEGYLVYLCLNRFYDENEILDVESLINEYLMLVDGFMYIDQSVYYILNNLNKEDKAILIDDMMITNSFELKEFLKLGINNCLISPILKGEQIVNILKNNNRGLVYVLGYLKLSYSKRRFLSFYNINKDIVDVSLNDSNYNILINQEDKGTSIFENKIMRAGDWINQFKNYNCDFLVKDWFIDENEIIKELNEIRNIIDNDFNGHVEGGFYNGSNE